MNRFRFYVTLGVLGALAAPPFASAQQVSARIAYIYPSGGQQGTSFQVEIAGVHLDGVANALVSGSGVQATVIEHIKPLSVEEAGLLMPKMEALMEKKKQATRPSASSNWTAEDEKELAGLREKFSTFIPKAQVNPAIVELVTLQVTIASDAEPGERDLRLRTPLGLTNPRVFCVGQLPEFSRKPARTYRQPKDGRGPVVPIAEGEIAITLPATVNGQVMPGGADRFRFKARQGQRLVCAISARKLIPYLSDTVPGWFQASLSLLDAKGRELAHAERYSFDPDAMLYFVVPKDGEYVIEIKDGLYRGREDFVYRVMLAELPVVTSIFPLGGPAGAQTSVELKGWNLPVARLKMDTKGKEPGIHPLRLPKGNPLSNQMPFAVDTLPECLEQEPNNSQAQAQSVALPIIVNGRIDQSGDMDVFRFEGRAGDKIVAEVTARRLNSPLDSVLTLTGASGERLAVNDDHEDKGSGLNTHHADSYLRAKLPANGVYYLHLGDVQHSGGPDYGYRLRISAPRPDFELRMVPSTISARAGTTVPITVYALRKDGFADEIALALKDAPDGFNLGGGRVPANQDRVRLTITFPPTPRREPFSLRLEGRAAIQGRDVSHPAVAAEDMTQAFAYRHLVPVREQRTVVMRRDDNSGSAKLVGESTVRIPVGGTARVRLDTSASPFKATDEYEPGEAPAGVTIQKASSCPEGVELVLHCDATAKPGLKGNLIVQVFPQGSVASAKSDGKGNKRRRQLGVLPAIPVEVVAGK
ncbi:MAG: PPC domain-containing protein [Verrucomicrobia bacterium]|nr:PPC domain-containing protein [Verrucomicrobiota bacterium]